VTHSPTAKLFLKHTCLLHSWDTIAGAEIVAKEQIISFDNIFSIN
jgi:hypothetical protein